MNEGKTDPKLAQIINLLEINVTEARELAMEFDRKSRELLELNKVSESGEHKEEPQPGGALPILEKLAFQLGEVNSRNKETLKSLNELI